LNLSAHWNNINFSGVLLLPAVSHTSWLRENSLHLHTGAYPFAQCIFDNKREKRQGVLIWKIVRIQSQLDKSAILLRDGF
jgi:hypothetical protein